MSKSKYYEASIQRNITQFLPEFDRKFDMIFADPPYFLSNNGLSIQNGHIVSVNKGMYAQHFFGWPNSK